MRAHVTCLHLRIGENLELTKARFPPPIPIRFIYSVNLVGWISKFWPNWKREGWFRKLGLCLCSLNDFLAVAFSLQLLFKIFFFLFFFNGIIEINKYWNKKERCMDFANSSNGRLISVVNFLILVIMHSILIYEYLKNIANGRNLEDQ